MTDNAITVADVVTYVEWLTFMPEWSFNTMPNYYSDDGVVLVRIRRHVRDTDHPPMYNEALSYGFTRDVYIGVRQHKNLDDVGHAILTECINWLNDNKTNEHEAREFFRVNESHSPTGTGPAVWRAPFHPHRLSGDREWKARRQDATPNGC